MGKYRLSIILASMALAFAAVGLAEVQITGAGATFPNPIYQKWFNEFHKIRNDAQINYQAIGSGGGIKQVTEGTVEFGATDGPMNDEQLADFQKKRGFGVLHLPTVLGAVVPTYNVAGVSSGLNFTPEALSGIFLGTITKWSDPELKKANPSASLPDADIVVVHRSDGSGTTYCLDRLPSEGQPGLEGQGRHGNFRELAGRHRRQGQ